MGMSDALPNICYYDSSGQGYGFTKPYSEETSLLIDKEVQAMINSQYERAKQLLREHTEGHNKLADLLLEKEVIFATDLKDIFGTRPWISRSEEIQKEVERNTAKAEEKEKQEQEAKLTEIGSSTGLVAEEDQSE